MNLKNFVIGLGVAFILFLSYVIYQLSTFEFFDDELKVVKEISVPNKNYLIKIYYVPSNATTQPNIQVRKIENNVEEVIKSYERFNYLNNYEIIGNETLKLSISDTSKINVHIEEVNFKLP